MTKGRAYLIQVLLIVPWLPFAALSGMAYDTGHLWPVVLFIGPFQAYPLLIVISYIASARFNSLNPTKPEKFVIWLAPIISFGSVALLSSIGGLLVQYAQTKG